MNVPLKLVKCGLLNLQIFNDNDNTHIQFCLNGIWTDEQPIATWEKCKYLDGEGEDFNAHLAHIWGGNFPHQLCKLVSVLVDRFNTQGTWNTPVFIHHIPLSNLNTE